MINSPKSQSLEYFNSESGPIQFSDGTRLEFDFSDYPDGVDITNNGREGA